MNVAIQKANDPAAIALAPGHDSISHGDAKMNEAKNTTPAAVPPDVTDMEGPIMDASRMASILSRLLTESFGGKPGVCNAYHLTNRQCEDMLFAAYHTEELIRRIYTKMEELA